MKIFSGISYKKHCFRFLDSYFRETALPLLIVGLFAVMPIPAYATGGISCWGIDSDAAVDMVLGAGPVPNILDIRVSDGLRVISTREETGIERGHVAQSYLDGALLKIDMMDDQVSKKLVSVRILRVTDLEQDDFQIGYLQLEENMPLAIRCEGP